MGKGLVLVLALGEDSSPGRCAPDWALHRSPFSQQCLCQLSSHSMPGKCWCPGDVTLREPCPLRGMAVREASNYENKLVMSGASESCKEASAELGGLS